jgi:hypothetical protein
VFIGATPLAPSPILTNGMTYSALTGAFTIPITGTYRVSCGISTSGTFLINIEVNGIPFIQTLYSTNADNEMNGITTILDLSSGDVVTLNSDIPVTLSTTAAPPPGGSVITAFLQIIQVN